MNNTDTKTKQINEEIVKKIKEDLKPLMFSPSLHTEEELLYFSEYNLKNVNSAHSFGNFNSEGFSLAAHFFNVRDAAGTVIILHGYMNHSGALNILIDHCLDGRLNVACFDLPGHGLSSGKDAAIDDFRRYSKILYDFYLLVSNELRGPFHFIGHSTGASAVLTLLIDGFDPFKNIILAAPLIRFTGWNFTKLFKKVLGENIEKIPGRILKNIVVKNILSNLICPDILRKNQISSEWVEANYNWYPLMAGSRMINRKIHVLQGTADIVVFWKHNIKLLKRIFSQIDIKFIKNGQHDLFSAYGSNNKSYLKHDVRLIDALKYISAILKNCI